MVFIFSFNFQFMEAAKYAAASNKLNLQLVFSALRSQQGQACVRNTLSDTILIHFLIHLHWFMRCVDNSVWRKIDDVAKKFGCPLSLEMILERRGVEMMTSEALSGAQGESPPPPKKKGWGSPGLHSVGQWRQQRKVHMKEKKGSSNLHLFLLMVKGEATHKRILCFFQYLGPFQFQTKLQVMVVCHKHCDNILNVKFDPIDPIVGPN